MKKLKVKPHNFQKTTKWVRRLGIHLRMILQVWYTAIMVDGTQRHAIVAAKSRRAAAALLDVSDRFLKEYGSADRQRGTSQAGHEPARRSLRYEKHELAANLQAAREKGTAMNLFEDFVQFLDGKKDILAEEFREELLSRFSLGMHDAYGRGIIAGAKEERADRKARDRKIVRKKS